MGPADRQVTVELQDAMRVTADVLVIPSGTGGGFGEPWGTIVSRLKPRHRKSAIRLGQLRLESVLEDMPVQYLAFAATREDGQPTSRGVVVDIGAALGRLTTEDRKPLIRDIATPALGAGAGRLDSGLSLEALQEGFRRTADSTARLRIIEPDRAKYRLLEIALARLSDAALSTTRRVEPATPGSLASAFSPVQSEATGTEPAVWDELASDAQRAMALAQVYSIPSAVHMEQLLIALYKLANSDVRAWFGSTGIDDLVSMASRSGIAVSLDIEAPPITALPALSNHVGHALAAASLLGRGGSASVTSAHLLAGALSIDCGFIKTLLERGVKVGHIFSVANSSVVGSGAQRASVMAEPAADTVPETDVGLCDRLSVGREVEMLASVMLAVDTPLPLAIGLFGEWGSGKSFFMSMLDERLTQLSTLQRENDAPDEAVYCRHIRQVHFNAWHYVDGNLWASLAAAIFEGLVEEPDATAQEQKRDQLGDATKRAMDARRARVDAERALREEQQKSGHVFTIVRSAVPAAVQALRDTSDLQQQLDTPVESMTSSVEQFLAATDAARATGRQTALIGGLLHTELVKGRRAATLIWLGVVVAVAILLFVVGTWQVWAKTLLAIPVLLSSLSPALHGTARLLRSAQQARWRREQPVVEAQNLLSEAELTERLANEEVAAKESEFERLRDRGIRLQDLVRSARVSYGTQLSIVSQLRRDFEQLTWLLNDNGGSSTGLKEAAATLCAAETPPPADPHVATEARRPPPLEVDRIVLYIDDLDRCSAKDVVKVLQAVNLLLTFKLFVVVVGVDGRWLEASLSSHYDSLLRSPVEFLEKIIQLPFVLRTMSPEGYAALIADLTTARIRAPYPGETEDGTQAADSSPDADSPAVEDVASRDSVTAALDTLGEPRPARPESLVISEPERELLGQVGGLITTPRTAKRLINIYRMIRVCAGETDADKFSPDGDREYQAVIVLVSVLISRPDAKDVFDDIMDGAPDADVWDLMRRRKGTDTEAIPGAIKISTKADQMDPIDVLQDLVDLSTAAAYQRWIPLVSRFTYHLPSVITPTPESV